MADVVTLPAPIPIEDSITDALIVDLARFSEGLETEAAIRRRHQLNEITWEALGEDDGLIARVEEEKIRRVRSGALKRERAQRHVTAAPDILNTIMCDAGANAKHKIEAAKTLDSFATGGSAAAAASERFVIQINLSAADNASGEHILHFDKPLAVGPDDSDSNTIEIKASENDPLGFAAAAAWMKKRKDDGGERL